MGAPSSRSKRSFDLFHPEHLDHIALADIAVIAQHDAALKARPDFVRVFLFTPERSDRAFVDDVAIAQQAAERVALHHAVEDEAACDQADLRRLEEAPDLDVPCLLYTSPSPRDQRGSRMPSSA